MTLTELHTSVRALVPETVTTFIELSIRNYSHRPGEEPEVEVKIWASLGYDLECNSVEAPTAAEALELFKIETLPKLGLSEPKPALERLEELEGIHAPLP